MARMTVKASVAARKSWQERAETWRDKISVSNILTRLQSHYMGKVEMTPTQVKAAQILLDRVMPTLSASEVTRKNDNTSPEQLVQMLRDRYGDAMADAIAPDYLQAEVVDVTPDKLEKMN